MPWTTWLYPVIQPDETGYHLLVSNQPDPRALYNRILYMHLPYGDPGQIAPEVVVEIAPEGDFIAFGEAIWRDLDGYIYVTGQYQSPGQANQLFVFVRDPHTGAWTRQALSNAQVAAAYQRPGGSRAVWVASTYGSDLRLYRSDDRGGSWQEEPLADLASYGLVSSFFLHGISPASGSLMPSRASPQLRVVVRPVRHCRVRNGYRGGGSRVARRDWCADLGRQCAQSLQQFDPDTLLAARGGAS
ncbi:MAG: hypothetical protein J4F35_16040 [Candidatus Latescibacteria bacterium]|nr:hypothetical protein [Candidatus Latescibacterota bacterium]